MTPALLAREILLRLRFVVPGKMLGFLAVCVALAFSAFYRADRGGGWRCWRDRAPWTPRHPGRSWDTQSDMLMALLGALLSVSLLAGRQDRQIEHLQRAGAAD